MARIIAGNYTERDTKFKQLLSLLPVLHRMPALPAEQGWV